MKDRLVVLIDSELKKQAQIYGIKNDLSLTNITEKAISDYLKSNTETENNEA